jgi:hypothetical protein
MNSPYGEHFPPPSPEWLAAYADGEFEGNAALAAHKRFIEDWLECHPEAAADILAWRRLKRQWQETTAEEPDEATWTRLWSRVEQALAQPTAPTPRRRRIGLWWSGYAAAILLALTVSAWLIGQHLANMPAAPEEDTGTPVVHAEHPRGDAPDPDVVLVPFEPLPVASEEEVTILHVEGADAHSVVVGRMPANGPLELTQPDDVTLNSFEPDPSDNMVPDVHMDQGAAMIWARVGREMAPP